MKKTVTLYVDAELYEFVKKEVGSPSKFFDEAARNLKTKNEGLGRLTHNQEVGGSNPPLGTSVSWDSNNIESILAEMRLNNRDLDHIKDTRRRLLRFSEWCSYSCNFNDIIIYLDKIKKKYSFSEYYQTILFIRKLMKSIDAPFADKIKLPKRPKRRKVIIKHTHITSILEKINKLTYDSMRLRTKAAILVAATSGLRAEELYKLTLDNLDVDNRIIYVSAEITKNSEERVAFFSKQAKEALQSYIKNYTPKTPKLFPESNIRRAFKQLDTDFRLKHMRKFFSQQSDRLGMPTAIKKILMGHSLRGDVDLSHYDFQDEEELKKIYDRYWKDFRFLLG